VGQNIEVPVLTLATIGAFEGYQFFYETLPYQGMLDGSAVGTVLAQGPSIVTTAGSGTIDDFTYTDGVATFNPDSTVVEGLQTKWTENALSGNLISMDVFDSTKYVIASIINDTTLHVTEPVSLFYSQVETAYKIINKDKPDMPVANIVDRLPTLLSSNDAECQGESISTVMCDAYPVLSSHVVSAVQDVVGVEDIVIGAGVADRGRQTVSIPDAQYGSGTLGLKMEKLATKGNWQKTYQSYVLNKDDSGRLYLMVVSSESDGDSTSRFFNHMTSTDTVDLFEMPGRPLI
jgi:hypothetical protein